MDKSGKIGVLTTFIIGLVIVVLAFLFFRVKEVSAAPTQYTCTDFNLTGGGISLSNVPVCPQRPAVGDHVGVNWGLNTCHGDVTAVRRRTATVALEANIAGCWDYRPGKTVPVTW